VTNYEVSNQGVKFQFPTDAVRITAFRTSSPPSPVPYSLCSMLPLGSKVTAVCDRPLSST